MILDTIISPQLFKTKLRDCIKYMEKAIKLEDKKRFLSAERDYLLIKTIMYGHLLPEEINKVDIFEIRYAKFKMRIK